MNRQQDRIAILRHRHRLPLKCDRRGMSALGCAGLKPKLWKIAASACSANPGGTLWRQTSSNVTKRTSNVRCEARRLSFFCLINIEYEFASAAVTD
jgi:hypothetical protein